MIMSNKERKEIRSQLLTIIVNIVWTIPSTIKCRTAIHLARRSGGWTCGPWRDGCIAADIYVQLPRIRPFHPSKQLRRIRDCGLGEVVCVMLFRGRVCWREVFKRGVVTTETSNQLPVTVNGFEQSGN